MAKLQAQLTTMRSPVPGNVIVGVLIIVATAIVAAVIVINARVTYGSSSNHPHNTITHMLVGSTSALCQWPKCAHFAGQSVLLAAL
jgi:hypothetical protein